ncbi:unnamed protein product [Trichobilharzia regenti]|nr:unnamed protein product [Trichobilharzia regenti]
MKKEIPVEQQEKLFITVWNVITPRCQYSGMISLFVEDHCRSPPTDMNTTRTTTTTTRSIINNTVLRLKLLTPQTIVGVSS